MARAPGARSRTRRIKATVLAIGAALRDHPDLGPGDMFKLDTFSGQTLLMRPIPLPWLVPPRVWVPRPVTDVDITRLMEWLEVSGYDKIARANVDAAVDAEGVRNQFSSALDWLMSLPDWDEEVRLDKLATEICGAVEAEDGDDEETVFLSSRYLAAVSRAFVISIVARIMRPGCKVDTAVVLEGAQGALKGTLLRVLAVRDEWFSDSFPTDMRDRDAMQHLPGLLIVEMSEMEQMKASRLGAVKGFLSRTFDRFRPSYGRRNVHQKRQCVFVGTTNTKAYLHDSTGNRRFWPMACGRIDIAKAKAWRDQLYAEALRAFMRGEKWWLEEDLEQVANEIRGSRELEDFWTPAIMTVIDAAEREAVISGEPWSWITTRACLDAIDPKLVTSERRGAEMRAAEVLQKQGFRRHKRRVNMAKTEWQYRRKVGTNGNGGNGGNA